jgi:bacterioferritin
LAGALRAGPEQIAIGEVASPLPVAYDAGMRGDAEIIELLNEVLTSELTAINQYFIHYRMLENQGYKRLSKQKREESIEEMKHADEVIERILFLNGVPNMQRLFSVRVGEEPVEMHKLDLAVETEQRDRLARGIALSTAKGDHGTRHLLEEILNNEEESIDWLETQLHLIEELGRERYLAEQMFE